VCDSGGVEGRGEALMFEDAKTSLIRIQSAILIAWQVNLEVGRDHEHCGD